MPDFLGLTQDQNKATSTDIFGLKSPLSLAGQPALPQGGPASAGTSAAPATIGGGGTAPAPKGPGPQSPNFGDLAAGAMPEGGGGSGSPGPGEGSPVGPGQFESFSTQAGPFGLSGNPFGVTGTAGPFGLTLGLGGLSPSLNLTDSPAVNSAINAAGRAGLNFAGLPSSLTLSFITNLAQAPALASMFAGAVSAMSPFSILSTIHNIASMSPSTLAGQISSLQSELNSVMADPQLTPEMQAQMLSNLTQQLQSVNAQGPRTGGPQAIGNLPFDNPVSTLGQSPNLNTPEAQSQNLSQTPALAALAAALGLGREDSSGPSASGPGPGAAGPGAGTASGDSSTGGDPGGSTY